MLKQFLILTILLSTIGLTCAGEIVKEDRGAVFIYGEIEDCVYMSSRYDQEKNYNRTVCINATCVEGEINLGTQEEYELDYTFIADINDITYISRIVTLKQEIISSSWFLSRKNYNRSLTIDGIAVASYQTESSVFTKIKSDTLYFCLVDKNIRYGEDIIINESLAFTQLNYNDQQELLSNISTLVIHKYITVGMDGENSLKVTGLTGIFYNILGMIPKVGESLQSLLFLPLTIIQYTFNFIFSFLFLIINNWWYALLILEIMCIIPALQYKTYPEMTGTFINMHIKIFIFMWENVILNLINLVFRIVEIIRNMFRI